mgnify:CR=1 FL=1
MRKRILIINENVDEAEKIKERLVSAYNDVECVTSISDAVNRFVSMDFTLVILDANMSMEDDHKLLKVMRQAVRVPPNKKTGFGGISARGYPLQSLF